MRSGALYDQVLSAFMAACSANRLDIAEHLLRALELLECTGSWAEKPARAYLFVGKSKAGKSSYH